MTKLFAALLTCLLFACVAKPPPQTAASPTVAATLPARSAVSLLPAMSIEAEASATPLLPRFQTIMKRYQQALDLFEPLVEQIHRAARTVRCQGEHQRLRRTFWVTRGANDRAVAFSNIAYSQLAAYHPQDQPAVPMIALDLYESRVQQMMMTMVQTETALIAFTECLVPLSSPKPTLLTEMARL